MSHTYTATRRNTSKVAFSPAPPSRRMVVSVIRALSFPQTLKDQCMIEYSGQTFDQIFFDDETGSYILISQDRATAPIFVGGHTAISLVR